MDGLVSDARGVSPTTNGLRIAITEPSSRHVHRCWTTEFHQPCHHWHVESDSSDLQLLWCHSRRRRDSAYYGSLHSHVNWTASLLIPGTSSLTPSSKLFVDAGIPVLQRSPSFHGCQEDEIPTRLVRLRLSQCGLHDRRHRHRRAAVEQCDHMGGKHHDHPSDRDVVICVGHARESGFLTKKAATLIGQIDLRCDWLASSAASCLSLWLPCMSDSEDVLNSKAKDVQRSSPGGTLRYAGDFQST